MRSPVIKAALGMALELPVVDVVPNGATQEALNFN
jgi:hypothetical protein